MKKTISILMLALLLNSVGLLSAGKSVDDVIDEVHTKTVDDVEAVVHAVPAMTATSSSGASSISIDTGNTATDAGGSAVAVKVAKNKSTPSNIHSSDKPATTSGKKPTPTTVTAKNTKPVAVSVRPVAISTTKSLSAKQLGKSGYVVSRACVKLCKARKVNVTTSNAVTSVLSKDCELVCKNKSITIRKKVDDIVKEKPTVKRICTASPSQLRKLNGLLMRLKNAETGKSNETTDTLKKKIMELRKHIVAQMQKCKRLKATTNVVKVDSCRELKAWLLKYDYYNKMENYTEAKLKARGLSKDRYRNTMQELEQGIKRLRLECEEDIVDEPEVQTTARLRAYRKPVIVDNASKIRNYYRLKVAQVLSNETDTDPSYKLKLLKAERANLTVRLLQNRNVSMDELEDLSDEVLVSKDSVTVDGVKFKSKNRLRAKLKGKPVSVYTSANGAVLSDGKHHATVKSMRLNTTAVKVGSRVVKITPSTAATNAKVKPKTIILSEDNGKAMYKISASEDKKILWVIPARVDSTHKVSAEDGKVISSEWPWWAGLAG